MREILFRGKSAEDGKWFTGQLLHFKSPVSEKELNVVVEGCEWDDSNELFNIGRRAKVVPETVGQYTGLTDKNGKKIFEGDMIKPFDDEIDNMVVEFRHGQFLLCLYGERGYMAEYGWEESRNYVCFEADPLLSYGDDIEVIGNIHDTPEPSRGDTNG